MTDESRLGRAGTGVATGVAETTVHPAQMILGRAVVEAPYTLLLDADAEGAAEPDTAIPLAAWLERRATGPFAVPTGAIILAGDDMAALRPWLAELPFVAVHFRVFSDGRGYSHAHRLRTLWGYAGPVIAFGDVLRDQLLYMSRVGIDGFYMRQDQDLVASLAAFGLYSQFYQYNQTDDTSR
jgi:uncharacterized protein (DUF934 family)